MLIPVDHGNKNCKTEDIIFGSAIGQSKVRPGFGNYLFYNNEYYFLSSTRTVYKKDKTIDQTYFILTLIAVAEQMLYKKTDINKKVSITLPVGLPPKYFGKYYEKFEEYFLNRGLIEFEYKNKHFQIEIIKAPVYPQAYSALFTVPDIINRHNKIILIDIGGITVDIVVYEDGEVAYDLSNSIESGIIKKYNQINSIINSEFGIDLKETDIDKIFKYESELTDVDITDRITNLFKEYTKELIGQLKESLQFETSKPVFLGGTSILLSQLISEEFSSKPYFIDDIHANAKGYRILFNMENNLR